jgi:uncharacterized protein YkwD
MHGAAAVICLVVALVSAQIGFAAASPTSEARTPSLAGVQKSIRECANRNRRAAGLEPLLASSILTEAARLAAKDMATQGFFSHVDPQGRDPEDRVRIFDPEGRFTFVGENIAAGYPSVHAVCVGWMHSPGHRANILHGGYTHIGGGFATGGPYHAYYVQVFARLTSPSEEGQGEFALDHSEAAPASRDSR